MICLISFAQVERSILTMGYFDVWQRFLGIRPLPCPLSDHAQTNQTGVAQQQGHVKVTQLQQLPQLLPPSIRQTGCWLAAAVGPDLIIVVMCICYCRHLVEVAQTTSSTCVKHEISPK